MSNNRTAYREDPRVSGLGLCRWNMRIDNKVQQTLAKDPFTCHRPSSRRKKQIRAKGEYGRQTNNKVREPRSHRLVLKPKRARTTTRLPGRSKTRTISMFWSFARTIFQGQCTTETKATGPLREASFRLRAHEKQR